MRPRGHPEDTMPIISQPPLPGIFQPIPEPNPQFEAARRAQANLVYASPNIVAEWFNHRDGRRAIKLYRPYDESHSALYTTGDRAEAIKICLSVDDHDGEFAKAKRSGFKRAVDEHAEAARRRVESERETENIRWILHCSMDDVNWKGALNRLTNDELAYCLSKEKRKSSLSRLRALSKRRGIEQ
jgi:hypothetical protein